MRWKLLLRENSLFHGILNSKQRTHITISVKKWLPVYVLSSELNGSSAKTRERVMLVQMHLCCKIKNKIGLECFFLLCVLSGNNINIVFA